MRDLRRWGSPFARALPTLSADVRSMPCQRPIGPRAFARLVLGLLSACAVPVLIASLTAVPAEARRFALVVGNNAGGPDLDSLRYAEQDARRMADVLTRLAGFAPADVAVLTGADSAGLEAALKDMRARLGAPGAGLDALFLFYYSGHSDRHGLRLGGLTYPLERLRDNLAAVPGQVKIGVFDACQSGLMTRFKGGSTGRPITLESLRNIQGQVVIASSSMDEKSQESDQLGSSIFTHHWVNGLQGSADLDGDRRVTLAEAYQYAYNMTVQTTSRTRYGVQHPTYQFRIQGEGDIVLSDLNLGRTGLVFGKSLEGKYLVLDRDRESLVADFYKPAGRDLMISLKGGDYRVVKVERDQWKVADATVPGDRPAEFEARGLKARPQVVNPIKGRLEGRYAVVEGPVEHRGVSPGATRRWGMSLKAGEGTGLAGLALLWNLRPDLQLQAGGGWLQSGSGLVVPSLWYPDGAHTLTTSSFLLARKYEGPYFIDGGLNLKTAHASAGGADGARRSFGWEAGIPVHVGFEIGPRRSIFATLSVGYLWIFTGGGDPVVARKSDEVRYIHTAESGLSMGLAVGFYAF